MRALTAPIVFGLVATGAALAAPVPVLTLRSADRSLTMSLADGAPFTSSYTQSIYKAPVVEELERRADAIHLLRVRSTDRRAVEYFGWTGPIHSEDGWYVEDAPPNVVTQLVIRTTAGYDQRITDASMSVRLAPRFGDEVRVTVRPAAVPRLVALLTAP